jgi:hypothetical protein
MRSLPCKNLGSVHSIDFSSDGQLLASGYHNQAACLWDMNPIVASLPNENDGVTLAGAKKKKKGKTSKDEDGEGDDGEDVDGDGEVKGAKTRDEDSKGKVVDEKTNEKGEDGGETKDDEARDDKAGGKSSKKVKKSKPKDKAAKDDDHSADVDVDVDHVEVEGEVAELQNVAETKPALKSKSDTKSLLLQTAFTRFTPVYNVTFTYRNLLLAAGPFVHPIPSKRPRQW